MRVATRNAVPCRLTVKFQSTPPMRVATSTVTLSSEAATFQSTPPMRVATGVFVKATEYEKISIHATHAGGDWRP